MDSVDASVIMCGVSPSTRKDVRMQSLVSGSKTSFCLSAVNQSVIVSTTATVRSLKSAVQETGLERWASVHQLLADPSKNALNWTFTVDIDSATAKLILAEATSKLEKPETVSQKLLRQKRKLEMDLMDSERAARDLDIAMALGHVQTRSGVKKRRARHSMRPVPIKRMVVRGKKKTYTSMRPERRWKGIMELIGWDKGEDGGPVDQDYVDAYQGDSDLFI